MAIIMKKVAAMVVNPARTCTKCREKQVVQRSKAYRTVSCKFCGADISPRSA